MEFYLLFFDMYPLQYYPFVLYDVVCNRHYISFCPSLLNHELLIIPKIIIIIMISFFSACIKIISIKTTLQINFVKTCEKGRPCPRCYYIFIWALRCYLRFGSIAVIITIIIIIKYYFRIPIQIWHANKFSLYIIQHK